MANGRKESVGKSGCNCAGDGVALAMSLVPRMPISSKFTAQSFAESRQSIRIK